MQSARHILIDSFNTHTHTHTHTHRSQQQLPSAASVPSPSLSLSLIHRADKSPEAMLLINYSELQRAAAPQGLKISSVFHIPLTGGRHPAASRHAWLLLKRAQKTLFHRNVKGAKTEENDFVFIVMNNSHMCCIRRVFITVTLMITR